MTTQTFLTLNNLRTAKKPINYTLLWIAAIVFSFICGIMFTRFLESHEPHINLPEEYSLIKPTDVLKGNYDSLTNTLDIEFNNPKNR